jgi:hypothetical protein
VETYRCASTSVEKPCGKEFTSTLGPTVCPWCGSVWVEWVSFGKTPPEKKSVEQLQQEWAEHLFDD